MLAGDARTDDHDEMQYLRDRVEMLESEIGFKRELMFDLLLSDAEQTILRILYKRAQISHASLWIVLYGHLPDCDQPETKIVDVYICRIRAKLAEYGIQIENLWSFGYRLAPADKAKLRALIKPA